MYRIKVGNMYLSRIVTSNQAIANNFISELTFDFNEYQTLFDEDLANILADKIYIVTSVYCKVEKVGEKDE